MTADLDNGAVVALGEVLYKTAGDIAQRVLERWRNTRAGAEGSSDIYRDIVRTTELATITVAQYLTTGMFPTEKQAKTLAATGKAPLNDTISLKELTRLYLFWRDATIEVVQREGRQLEVGPAVVEHAIAVVHAGFDGSIMRMTNRFDLERRRLQLQLSDERARLEHQALHDGLTGLPNRALFLDRLAHALELGSRRLTKSAVLFIDLDRFKNINDIGGHAVGDEVLVEIGRRLQAAVRACDTVGRIGGDEFVVLCEDLDDAQEEAVAIAERISELVQKPIRVRGRELYASASIGVAPAFASQTAEGLLSQADRAMYVAKQRGGAQHLLYRMDLDKGLERRADLIQALHRAVERDEFDIHYQPVRMLDSRRVTDMEALLRWTHPVFGQVPPSEFIPLAEETGLIHAIGAWVLNQACSDCARWRREGAVDVGVTVNISGRQLEDGRLAEVVHNALERAGLSAGALTLELTESVLFSDRSHADGMLQDLRRVGVRVAIDDFGTGYSSLSYLSKYPIDVVKIDRSFVAGLGATSRNTTIVFATVELAHALGLTIVAEGVETESELAKLRDAHCDAVQGYLLGRPAPLDDSGDVLPRSPRLRG